MTLAQETPQIQGAHRARCTHLPLSAQKPNEERAAADEAVPASLRPSPRCLEARAEPQAQRRGEQETPVPQRGHFPPSSHARPQMGCSETLG